MTLVFLSSPPKAHKLRDKGQILSVTAKAVRKPARSIEHTDKYDSELSQGNVYLEKQQLTYKETEAQH